MIPNHSGTLVEEGKPQWRIPQWFDDLSDESLNRLKMFHMELISFNGRINLISPRTERNSDIIHFADSITAARCLLEQSDAQ